MADFKPLAEAVKRNVEDMSKGELFVVGGIEDIFGDYLGAFPEGTNPIYRERTEHDCSCCKGFIRNMGNVVSIENGALRTIWDANGLPAPYDTVADRMSALVKSKAIDTIFRTDQGAFGAASTAELVDGNRSIVWNHLHGSVARAHRSSTPAKDCGDIKSVVHVLRRGLQELKIEAVDTVIELAQQDLYRGAEFLPKVREFRRLMQGYAAAGDETARSIFLWQNAGNPAAKFRNEVIGQLVIDLSNGVDLDQAVRSFERMVAPESYKRTTSLITPKMVDNAMAKLAELGLESAIERRHARLTDVPVTSVLFVDGRVRPKMVGGSAIGDMLKSGLKAAPAKLANAEKITMETFIEKILPETSSLEVLLKSRHLSNFVSVTAPEHADAGRLFQWGNGFAWSYDGDVADSVKERVKKAGGNIAADLRVSLAWFNFDDLDLHAETPMGKIDYRQKSDHHGNRILDVDMNAGGGMTRQPVENLAWLRGRSLSDGHYRIMVHQFSRRETIDFGFTLEVEHEGHIFSYAYDKVVAGLVPCLDIIVAAGKVVKLSHAATLKPGAGVPQEKWGLNTEQMVAVDTLMLSPNHWEGEAGRGNKHWFFILKGCKNPDPVRGIYNEFLRPDLNEHRKVFEVLGAKSKAPVSDDQLSGIGFSAGRGDAVTVLAKGPSLNRPFEIFF